jgi:hypothetical protein
VDKERYKAYLLQKSGRMNKSRGSPVGCYHMKSLVREAVSVFIVNYYNLTAVVIQNSNSACPLLRSGPLSFYGLMAAVFTAGTKRVLPHGI